MNHTKAILAAAALSTVVAGCAAPGLGGGSYSREQARREQTVRMGYVESVREVQLEGTRSGAGAVGGAVLGGVGGRAIGRGTGSTVASVIGAVAGGVAG